MAELTRQELERHTEALWQLCAKYVADNGLEDKTTGILIVRELVQDETHAPNLAVMYVGEPRNAAITMARAAQSELQKANLVPGQRS